MTNIDDKVVSMSFESGKFESGVRSVMSALDKLKASLHFPDAGKGLDNINASAKRVDLSHISRGVDAVKQNLQALRLIAIGVFSQLTAQAIRAGGRFVSAFTLDPLKAGFAEYSTNLNAVQTILANTQAAGVKLKDVNAALLELNQYSDKTIYNFSQMAKNIGTFTAAGVELDTATAAIKGIANLAALSGSNADQASTAMYQLSQALAAGRVTLMDWNSVVNAGMGGTVFQRALAQTAVQMGTLKDNSLKLVGPMKNVSIAGKSFRSSLAAAPGKESWLTSDVLTKTLGHFTSDLTDAQLAAEGFSKADIMAIQAQAKTAMLAATQVKTLSQVLDVAKETAGSGWAQTWQLVFGDFGEAKKTFTALSTTINGFINKSAESRNAVLADWKALGGRTILIDSIKTAFQNLGKIMAPIKDAFREIFPATTGKNLFDLTVRFKEFANALKPSPETVANLKRTFAGLFAVLSIGKQIISGIFTVFGQLFGAVGGGQGGFLSLTASIGDFLVSIDKALKKGDGLTNFFVGLGKILAAPLKILSALAGALGSLFSGFSPGGISTQMSGITRAMTPLQRLMDGISQGWDNLMSSFDKSGAIKKVSELFTGLGEAIGNAASNMNFEAILAVVRTGLFAGLVLMFKQFLGRGSFLDQIGKGFGGGIIQNISGSFKALQGSMVAMQNNIKADTLKKIAIAVALLAGSIVALSFVDPKKLAGALGAMTVAFAELLAAMAILDKIGSAGGFIKIPFIAASMILLAGAIDLLTIAVIAMSFLSWNELTKGLAGVGVLLGVVSAAAIPLSANSAGLIRAGIGITAIAVGINILALAVRQFGSMNLEDLAKGLGAVGISLGIIILAMNKLETSKGMITAGAGLILIATGLRILAEAVQTFGEMDLRTLGTGLLAIGASLLIIGKAMAFFPGKTRMFALSAGLILVAVALNGIARAVVTMGGMSVEQIAKGLGTLAGSLGLLAIALKLMSGTKGGSVALFAAAAGVALLVPSLVLLGSQKWETIIKSLVALGAAFAVLAIAGKLITGAVPGLLGFGVAMLLIGGGLALAGAGVFLVGAGLSAIAIAGPTAIGILIAALIQLTEAFPEMVKNLVIGLLQMVEAFSVAAPKFVNALVKIINSLLDVIIKSSPKIVEAFTALLIAAIQVLTQNQDRIILAGYNLLLALLAGIKNNIGKVVMSVVDIIVKFLSTLTTNLGRITAAGVQLLVSFLKGIANSIGKVITAAVDIITKFISSMATNYGRIVSAGANLVVSLISGITKNVNKIITAGADAIISFVTGLGKNASKVITAGVDIVIKFIEGLGKNAVKLANAAGKVILDFLNGLTVAINIYAPQIRTASFALGIAIIDGMTFGMASKAQAVYNKASEIAGKALSILKAPWKALSPSRTMMELGKNIVDGMALGLSKNASNAYSSAVGLSNGVIGAFKNTFQITSPSKVMMEIGKFVGQGFAQGLRGSGDDVKAAFAELNEKLTDAMVTAREIIATEEDKLAKLREAKKPDAAAIAAAQKVILENQKILEQSTAAHKALVTTLKSEKIELVGLTKEYETLGNKLAAAQEVLKAATQLRTEAVKSFTDQYSTLPSIVTEDAEGNSVDQLATYMQALKHQADAVTAYQSTLDQLRKLGLDDATYQKLLTEGTANQAFATQLLAGGKTAVKSLNTLDANLMAVSKRLAVNAAANLYQAGIDAAQGLVNGLKAKHDDIRREMEKIAREMIRALRRELQMKSPSQAFAEIGRLSMLGLAKGFSDSQHIITKAMNQAAKDALNSMKQSMHNLSSLVTDELNPNPVITPILDLTTVKTQAEELASLTNVSPISAAASYDQASLISLQQRIAQEEMDLGATAGTSVTFEQNNYSPESLTEVEIYRQTRNQLSQLKSVLALT